MGKNKECHNHVIAEAYCQADSHRLYGVAAPHAFI